MAVDTAEDPELCLWHDVRELLRHHPRNQVIDVLNQQYVRLGSDGPESVYDAVGFVLDCLSGFCHENARL